MTAQRRPFAEGLHVFLLTSLALAQPIFGRLSRKTVYLHDQGIEPAAILLLVAILCLGVPALILLVELLARWFGRKARERTHDVLVYVLLAAIVIPSLKELRLLEGMVLVPFGFALAALGLVAYRRFAPVRFLVTAATPVILVVPGLLMFRSPITKVLFPRLEPEPAPAALRHPVPVVMVLFDEFCAPALMNAEHEIDAARLPNFATLAATATWYRNASSVHTRTEQAVPAILTGRYPSGRPPATLAEYPQNLFQLIEATQQYELVVFEPYTRLYQPKPETESVKQRSLREQIGPFGRTLSIVLLDHLLPRDLPFELPDIPREWNSVKVVEFDSGAKRTGVFRRHWDAGRSEQFDEFLERMVPFHRPPLYFAHVVVPHPPWCFLPSGRRYISDDGNGLPVAGCGEIPALGTTGPNHETWTRDELAASHGLQRFLLQVGFVDRLLGKLIDRLKQQELFDRSLIIVAADHGLAFRPGLSRRQPTDTSLPDIASIPLFIKLPGQRQGFVSDRNVESIDLLPTIVDVLGLDVNLAVDGESLLDQTRPERANKTFHTDRGPMHLDPRFDAKYQALDRMLASFGSPITTHNLCRIGPHPELIGQSVADLVVQPRSDVQITLLHPAASVTDRSRRLLPCYFIGRVRPGSATKLPVELAIAVNGTIQAVTRTYLDKAVRETWTAMLPEASLRAGENEVHIFVVASTDAQLSLAPTGDEPIVVTVAE